VAAKIPVMIVRVQILTETLTKSNEFSTLIKHRMPAFHKYLLIRQQPNFILLYYFAQYITAEYYNISVDIIQSLPPSHTIIQNFNFNELTYKISLTYVTFTAQWNGYAIVLAIEDDSYLILKYCAFESNTRKYAPIESFKFLII
jgi:hypothetical protein